MRRVHIAVQFVQELQDLRNTVRTRPARIMKKLQRVFSGMLSVPGSYRNWRGWEAVPLGGGGGGICWSVLYLSQSGDRVVCNGGRGRCKCFQNGNGCR